MMAKVGLLATAIVLLVPVVSHAQAPDSISEELVVCPGLLQPEPLTPYGFAKGTLVSLWFARNAAERATEIKKSEKESDNYFSFMTAMMRITKESTNDFVCAKRSVKPFRTDSIGENIKTAADFLTVVYNAHIGINQRILDLLKRFETIPQAELMDKISTLQVERDQRWADLVKPTELALVSLTDFARTDKDGHANVLIITRAQKRTLLEWADEHFPEFKNAIPKDQWSDPAKTAHMYFTFFQGRKCSDE